MNEKQLDEILAGIERGKAEGGTVVTGGERVDDDAYLLAPTVFEGVGRRRVPLVRGGLRAGHVALPLLRPGRGRSAARTRSSSGSRRRSSRATWPPRSASSTSSRRASCTSTRRRPARTSTSRSVGSRARASARTSRAARRWSSTRRSSPSTTMSDERWLVTGALGCIGAWTAVTLVREGTSVVALRPRRRRPAAAADRDAERDRRDHLRPRRHHRPPDGRARARRARDHARRPPRRAAGAVLPREPRAGRPGERDRHRERLRGGEAAGLETTIAYASSAAVYDRARRRSHRGRSTASTSWRTRAPPRSTRPRRRRQRRAPALHGLRPGPRPGPDRRPDARDRRRRARRAIPDRVRRTRRSSTTRGDVAPRLRPGGALGSRPARRRFCLGGPATAIADFVAAGRPRGDRARRSRIDDDAAAVSRRAARAVVRLTADAARGGRPRDRCDPAKRRIVGLLRPERGEHTWPRCVAATSSSST